MDGTENVLPLMIETAMHPRCFGELTPNEHGLDYDFREKAWMNTPIFFRWLELFNASMARKPGRRVLLFVDNASVHGKKNSLPRFEHVRVVFLPKNTTSILQPLDLGVIACVKMRYKNRILNRAVDLIEGGYDGDPYRIDLRLASLWIYEIWEQMENEIIFNCWKKSGIVQFTVIKCFFSVFVSFLVVE